MYHLHYAYRPDIDGLRAIAVASVIAFHAFPDSLPGGFVGVDIFFVISGFLITTILQREIAVSAFSIKAFYARRVKRLFPALAVVLISCLAVGWAVLLEDEYRQLGKHASAGAGFVANIVFWAESGYFDTSSELKPLLHLWSLGIEEQFYLAWPLIIALAFKTRLNFLMVGVALSVLSFAANINLFDSSPVSALFIPYPRLWELMIGGLLAHAALSIDKHRESLTSSSVRDRLSRRISEISAILGLILIVLALAGIDKHKGFPGWWALLPTLGSLLLIGAGPETWISRRLLSRPALVFIGLISYPLYLWHWPLLSFARIVFSELPPVEVRIAIVAVTVVLAWATYRYVELPVRNLARPGNRPITVIASLGTAVVAVFIAGLLVNDGIPRERLDDLSLVLSEATRDWNYPGDEKAFLKGTSDESVLFFGDSYVAQLYPRMEEIAKRAGGSRRTVIFHTAPGCAPIPGIARKSIPICSTYSQSGFELAASEPVKAVVIGGSWFGMLERGDYYDAGDETKAVIDLKDPARLQAVLDGFERALARLEAMGKDVYVVLNPPGGGRADPRMLKGSRISLNQALEVKSIPIDEHLRRTGAINARIRAAAERAGATVIDPLNWLCSKGECAFTDAQGIPYFKDPTHLRASFVRCCIEAFDDLVVLVK